MNKELLLSHLLDLGFPADWAILMVRVSDGANDPLPFLDPADALSSFAVWDHTPQGHRYWADLTDAVAENGVGILDTMPLPLQTKARPSHQEERMLYDPATREGMPYPSHAAQWRKYHSTQIAWIYNPWTGEMRHPADIGSDIQGLLIENE